MPGITVAHIQGNHPQSRCLVSTRPILAGQILWLPPKEELRIDVGLKDGCYNHPVVVLSPELSNGNVVILTLTSFNGVDLSVKHAHNINARLAHLPIEPCSPHPDNGILLSLEGNVFLDKNSYVKTENRHTLPVLILRRYGRSGKSFVLTNDSYQKLINYVNFIPVTSPTMNPHPDDQDRLLRLPCLISQSAAGLSTPGPNCRCNENPRSHLLEDEERRLHRDSPYRTIQNTPYTQHDTSRSHGNFTDNSRALTGWNTRTTLVSHNSRYAQYSRPDPWPNPGSGGENPRSHLLEDEEHRLHRDGSYRTIQNTPHTQHDTSRSHGNFTDNSRALTGWNTRTTLVSHNSRYAQYSRPDPWPNPESGGDDGEQMSPTTAVFILVLGAAIFGAASFGLYWVAVQAIEVAKGVAKSAWDWIRGVLGGL